MADPSRPVVHRRIDFVPGRPAGTQQAAQVAELERYASERGFQLHVIRADKRGGEHGTAEQNADATKAKAQEVDPYLSYLPQSTLYPDETEGRWNDLFAWRKIAPIGPGFSNLGNTCFLNSVLQCLTYIPVLAQLCLRKSDAKRQDAIGVKILQSMDYIREVKAESLESIVERAEQAAEKQGCPERFCALGTIVRHMQAIHVGLGDAMSKKKPNQRRISIAPSLFVRNLNKLSCASMRVGKQHDAHEFLRLLVDCMQRSCALAAGLPDTSNDRSLETSAVMRLFGGYTESVVSCGKQACGASSSNFEPFMDISLDVADDRVTSVDSALLNYHAREKLDFEWNCPSCGKVESAYKQLFIRKAPPILVLHLKRFGFGGRGRKVGKQCDFKTSLDLSDVMIPKRPPGSVTYDLTGLVVHCGRTINLGHYICFVKGPNGTWYMMDDDVVRHVSLQKVLEQEAYLLFYSKRLPPRVVGSKKRDGQEEEEGEEEEEEKLAGESMAELADFASKFSAGAAKPPINQTVNVNASLFGNFLDDDEGDEDEPIGSDRQPKRQTRRAAKVFTVWFPRLAWTTQKYTRSLYFQALVERQRIKKLTQMIYGTVENDDNDSKEASPKKRGDRLEQVEEAGSSDDDDDDDVAPTHKRESKNALLRKAAAGEQVVVLNPAAQPSQVTNGGKRNWEQFLQRKQQSQQKSTSTFVYDDWDAALDRGRMKKVKTSCFDDKSNKRPNAFQQKQNRANANERKRKGLPKENKNKKVLT